MTLAICLVSGALPACSRADESKARVVEELRQALAANDAGAVRAVVARARAVQGDAAGIPETADEFRPAPADTRPLTAAEAQVGFAPHFKKLQRLSWWKVGMDPRGIRQALRAPASVLAGNVAAGRARLDGAEQSLAVAREAAEFLIWAQEQAGAGCYPFPAARGVKDNRAMEVADRFIRHADQSGKLASIERNGWIFDDLEDGGLQFDNAECGVAMLDYYTLSGEERALASVRKAAAWAMARPLVTNWNYNSFSVWLLARTFVATGDPQYLESAVTKALVGVIPGQIPDGPRAGRWHDAHNARPAYHYIMLRALAELAIAMPPGDARRAEVIGALALGLKSRNAEIVSRGVMNKDKAFEALLVVQRSFAREPEFLRETQTTDALQAIVRLVSEEARRGKLPLGPGEWGKFLEMIVTGW